MVVGSRSDCESGCVVKGMGDIFIYAPWSLAVRLKRLLLAGPKHPRLHVHWCLRFSGRANPAVLQKMGEDRGLAGARGFLK